MGGKGSGKKKQEPEKKMVKKYRVLISKQWRDFDGQEEARKYAREVLQNDAIYFMSCEKVEVEEKQCTGS